MVCLAEITKNKHFGHKKGAVIKEDKDICIHNAL